MAKASELFSHYLVYETKSQFYYNLKKSKHWVQQLPIILLCRFNSTFSAVALLKWQATSRRTLRSPVNIYLNAIAIFDARFNYQKWAIGLDAAKPKHNLIHTCKLGKSQQIRRSVGQTDRETVKCHGKRDKCSNKNRHTFVILLLSHKGGTYGVRTFGALAADSALAVPRNRYAHKGVCIFVFCENSRMTSWRLAN